MDVGFIISKFKNYVIIKLNEIFPNYNINQDIDILTTDLDKNLKIIKKYRPKNYNLKITELNENHIHVDYFHKSNLYQLIFRIDLFSNLIYENFNVHESLVKNVLKNRIKIKRNKYQFYIPKLDDDLSFRYMEYIEYINTRPDKIKHLKYINSYPEVNFKKVIKNELNYSMNYNLKNKINNRFDSFIIWYHGFEYLNEIIKIINQHDCDILYIKKNKYDDVLDVINLVYSFDNSIPKEHLNGKTKYLQDLNGNEFYFIIVLNKNYIPQVYGKNTKFEISSCKNIVNIKWKIRELFNPKFKNDTLQPSLKLKPGVSHNHVIHACDTLDETVELSKHFCNFHPNKLLKNSCVNGKLKSPYFLKEFKTYKIEQININDVKCRIFTNNNIESVNISETPHYKYITGDKNKYINYINKYIGIILHDNHLPYKYDNLIRNFDVKNYNFDEEKRFIFVNKNNEILDGLHRICILYNENNNMNINVIKLNC